MEAGVPRMNKNDEIQAAEIASTLSQELLGVKNRRVRCRALTNILLELSVAERAEVIGDAMGISVEAAQEMIRATGLRE